MSGAGGDTGGEGTAAAGPFSFSPEPTLEDIRRLHAEFAAERDWDQFHQPRNLLLALVGEVGELAELFQWKPDEEPGPQAWPARERAALQEELSDVLIYLVALAARSEPRANSFPHTSQAKGLGPRWLRWWLRRLQLSTNRLPQSVQMYGLSWAFDPGAVA
uniref:dCTP pyrophosphatase 1 n=1 Tax=Oryctolagus cuniculus TaxID=9986 RepID=A0A5F9DSH5_RABIT